MSKIDDYLVARGCQLTGQSGKLLKSFALPGERVPGGRFLVRPDGAVELWHLRAKDGLNLGEPWLKDGSKEVNAGPVPVYKVRLRDLAVSPDLEKLSFAPRPQQTRIVVPDSAVRDAAADLLVSMGWTQDSKSKGIEAWNDGRGSTPACRLYVQDGLASVWSYRGDLDMPSPWRQGRLTKDGNQSWYVTGRDLGLTGEEVARTAARPRPAQPTRDQVDKALVEYVKAQWQAGSQVSPDHRHMKKSGAQLDPVGLRAFPDTPENRQKHVAGDVLIPLFRPVPGDKQAVEVCGAQRLMGTVWNHTDKLLMSGSRPAGAFVPLPVPDSMLRSGQADLSDWLVKCDTSKPLVICEGVSTGLAIKQTGEANVVCAISSNNLIEVARYLKRSGLAEQFPGLVIAADFDVAKTPDGRLKSAGIIKAAEAAVVAEAGVALAPPGSPSGCDARDLLARGGEAAVRDYLDGAVSPREIFDRRDVFPARRETEPDQDIGLGR